MLQIKVGGRLYTQKKGDSPPEHFDFVLQRVLFALQGFFVDDFDGVHLARLILALSQTHLGEGATETAKIHNSIFNVCNSLAFYL